MANNRLFIQDTETGDVLLVARSSGPTWYFQAQTSEQIDEWLNYRDSEAAIGADATKLRLATEGQLLVEGYEWHDGHLRKPQGEQP